MVDAKLSDFQPVIEAISTELPQILTIAGNAIELIKQLKDSAANPASTTVFSPADQQLANSMLGQLQQAKVSADNLQQALNDALAPAPSTEPAPAGTPPTSDQPQAGGTDAPPSTPAPNPATPAG